MEHLESPQNWWPTGTGVVVQLTASWGIGTWVELAAAASEDAMLSCLVHDEATAQGGASREHDIGRGAAGVEVLVARVRTVQGVTADRGPCNVPFDALLYMIASGDRVSVRSRKETATNRNNEVSVGYVSAAAAIAAGLTYMGTGAGAGSQLKSMPNSAQNAVMTPSATPWNNSGYAQLSAAVADDLILHHLTYAPGGNDQEQGVELDLAVGAAGVEVVEETVAIGMHNTSATYEGSPHIALLQLYDGIPNGSRLTIRMRKSGTVTTAVSAGLGYFEKP